MIEFNPEPWEKYSKKLPWVCGLMTYNSEMTIYGTLKYASKMFDAIIITDDGSTDETFEEVKRFQLENDFKNIFYLNVKDWDPIPTLKVKKDHGSSYAPVTKTISKARIKNFMICKDKIPHSIYFALEDDVIVDPSLKNSIKKKISLWKEPQTDCEFFNVVNMINKDWLRLSNPDPNMKRRKSYENAGDWTYVCWYTSGKLTVGPDPGHPYGPCLFPWLHKNQIHKKGQNNDYPYGYHFLYYRKNRNGFNLEDKLKRIKNICDLDDDHLNYSLINDIEFKSNISVEIKDQNAILRIKE